MSGKANTSHTHTASDVTDFDTEVSANTDVAANTTARHTHANQATLDATTASFTSAKDTKLSGIATGATANDTDANLKNRANHTGTQTASTISDFDAAVAANSAVTANTAKVSNATHTGDATGATALTLATVNSNTGSFGSATQVATFTVNGKGLTTAAGNTSIQIAESQVTNLVSDLSSKAASSHTHAQSDVTNLTTDLAAKAPLASPTFTGTVTLPAGQVVNGVTLTTAGGTSNFLRADGTYAAPPGGGGGSPGGSTGEVQYNNAGAFAGAANIEVENGNLRLPAISTPSTPAADGINLFGRKVANRTQPAFIGPSGLDSILQESLARNKVAWWSAAGNGTAVSSNGFAFTATGTATAANVATTNQHTWMRRIEYLVTTASTTAVAGWRAAAAQFGRGNAAGLGGFWYVCRFGPATGVATTTNRSFTGLRNITTAPTDVGPSSLVNLLGCGWDAADTNIQIMYNDATGTATKVDTGITVPTVDRTSVYELAMFCAPNGSTIYFEFTDLVNGTVFTTSTTTDIPANTTLLAPQGWMSVGGTSSVIGYAFMSCYIATDL